jgi:hypothetical protein
MTLARRLLIVAGIVVIAALLAFPLRETIYDTIVVPAAFIFWGLKLFYRSFAQLIWWWLSVVFVVFMLIFSLLPRGEARPRRQTKSKPKRGQVEDLAIWLGRADHGTYFKWLVANRLGKLAYQMLLHRESGRPRSVFAPLVGTDWKPSKELQSYLETGLHGSFSDYPTPRRFTTPSKTPLDHEIGEVVEFLESQAEGLDSR